ncbi:flagellar hook-associated protein FlgK [Stomatohabitans albus]|uniref:flagellar hook-associated protein FlgK n=1 Tax=Stomatohabitans albus TaxID=3110766 RepID=UPI00300C1541
MVSTFGGINIAHSALMTSRMALEVSGQNIANMKDPNYSQQVVRTDSKFLSSSGVFAGQQASFDGIGITQLSRVTDQFLIGRHNAELSSEGFKKERVDLLVGVERTYNEPSDHGLTQTLSAFWDSWDSLAATPQDQAAKTAVIRRGEAVAESIHYAANNLDAVRENHYKRLEGATEEANALIKGIANLNREISANSLEKKFPPNELLDKRDTLVRELSSLAKVTVSFSKTDELFVHLNGVGVVGGGGTYSLLRAEKVHDATNPANFTARLLVGTDVANQRPIELKDGRLAALYDSINHEIPEQQAGLDKVAYTLYTQVNELHLQGRSYSGTANNAADTESREFFAYPGKKLAYENGKLKNTTDNRDADIADFNGISRSIQVNSVLRTDSKLVATRWATPTAGGGAPTVEGPLGNKAAVKIAELASKSDGADATYRNTLTNLGVKSRSAQTSLDQQKAQTKRANEERLSVSGVNADEETLNMAAQLKAYQAAARYMNTLDTMLDTLINGTGRVGR